MNYAVEYADVAVQLNAPRCYPCCAEACVYIQNFLFLVYRKLSGKLKARAAYACAEVADEHFDYSKTHCQNHRDGRQVIDVIAAYGIGEILYSAAETGYICGRSRRSERYRKTISYIKFQSVGYDFRLAANACFGKAYYSLAFDKLYAYTEVNLVNRIYGVDGTCRRNTEVVIKHRAEHIHRQTESDGCVYALEAYILDYNLSVLKLSLFAVHYTCNFSRNLSVGKTGCACLAALGAYFALFAVIYYRYGNHAAEAYAVGDTAITVVPPFRAEHAVIYIDKKSAQ